MRPPRPPAAPAALTATTTCRPPSAWGTTAPAWRSPASCSSAATARSENSARGRWHPPEIGRARQALLHADAPRQAPRMLLPPRSRGRPPKTSGRNAFPKRGTPSTIMSPTRSQPGPWTEIRLGVRAHPPLSGTSTVPVKRYALGPASDRAPPAGDPTPRASARTRNNRQLGRLTRAPCTDKEQSRRTASIVRSLPSRTTTSSRGGAPSARLR